MEGRIIKGREERSGDISAVLAICTKPPYVTRQRVFTKLTLEQSKTHKSCIHIICQHNSLCLGKERNASEEETNARSRCLSRGVSLKLCSPPCTARTKLEAEAELCGSKGVR